MSTALTSGPGRQVHGRHYTQAWPALCGISRATASKQCFLAQMLAARFPDPNLSAWHCRGLEAFARCIAALPNLMSLILQKVCNINRTLCSSQTLRANVDYSFRTANITLALAGTAPSPKLLCLPEASVNWDLACRYLRCLHMSRLRTTLEARPRHTQAPAGGSATLPASALAASSLPMQEQPRRYSIHMPGKVQ